MIEQLLSFIMFTTKADSYIEYYLKYCWRQQHCNLLKVFFGKHSLQFSFRVRFVPNGFALFVIQLSFKKTFNAECIWFCDSILCPRNWDPIHWFTFSYANKNIYLKFVTRYDEISWNWSSWDVRCFIEFMLKT